MQYRNLSPPITMPQSNGRNRLLRRHRARRGSSVEMDALRQRRTANATKSLAWRPDVWKQFPWLGLLALVGVLICESASRAHLFALTRTRHFLKGRTGVR
jgi:hypothetical protein